MLDVYENKSWSTINIKTGEIKLEGNITAFPISNTEIAVFNKLKMGGIFNIACHTLRKHSFGMELDCNCGKCINSMRRQVFIIGGNGRVVVYDMNIKKFI